ncbi:helix-turn-helix transcriptional regulator [Rhizobium sp. 'Codium 1']|uniref:helix-turn-helix transcriptional regulator n=1 Tax=Rhizobium sp. 'Codium 1' TaxID=2940484 RepID=UPI001E3A1AA1|nr:YafY family protein [Rhizobium sp. 'Codium 1']MCC8934577.1 YafY family transcriptional regulator [Rhizobium sp. 'Codium 1']
MRKASRLFEIIQTLRLAAHPITAQQIAEKLEVTQRSIYRDIAALQAMRVPIEGERGVGYILRPGFHLPPLMFTAEETEAIVLGMALTRRTADKELREASLRVLDKIAAAVPGPLKEAIVSRSLYAWGRVAEAPDAIDFSMIRRAIRDEEKLEIDYVNEQQQATTRRIRPIAVIHYAEAEVIVGWCELRGALRNFRADRISACRATGNHFRREGDRLRKLWVAGWETGAKS